MRSIRRLAVSSPSALRRTAFKYSSVFGARQVRSPVDVVELLQNLVDGAPRATARRGGRIGLAQAMHFHGREVLWGRKPAASSSVPRAHKAGSARLPPPWVGRGEAGPRSSLRGGLARLTPARARCSPRPTGFSSQALRGSQQACSFEARRHPAPALAPGPAEARASSTELSEPC